MKSNRITYVVAVVLALALPSVSHAGKQEDILNGVEQVVELLEEINERGKWRASRIEDSEPPVEAPEPNKCEPCEECVVCPDCPESGSSVSDAQLRDLAAMKAYEEHMWASPKHDFRGGVVPSSKHNGPGLYHVDYWPIGGNKNKGNGGRPCSKGGFATFADAAYWLIENGGKHERCAK